MAEARETRTPPGILTPDIVAPDDGTTRARPAGAGTAMRSASLITAVCSFRRWLKFNQLNKYTCQERKLLQIFVVRSFVIEDRPRGVHLVH